MRADFPKLGGGIEDNEQRGRLLHFFANHELLATELMALVLLKFPEAPAEFRAGIVKTLKEEQMHTKLYLRRMDACGVQFGDLPVNGFFWHAVSQMATPLDYVTRLSLTFEQANLDYSRGYAKVFANSGDQATAALLERIYHDEINHVHYGLEWFRKWKREQSDWKAYVSQLEMPLSAARAKGGFAFNEEGRRKAGLDDEFISELKVYAQSKGRTPNVFWFNPGAEESLLSRGGESRAAKQVAKDLALLPAYLARSEDVVLVPEMPSLDFRTSLQAAGIELPELVVIDQVDSVAARKLHELRPWAKTPDAEVLMRRLGGGEFTSPNLFSKAEHAELIAKMLEGYSNSFVCGLGSVGRVVRSLAEVHEWMEETSYPTCVFKAPWSTAGRDRFVREAKGELTEDERKWLEKTVAKQGCVVAEPWLDRLIDFSIQYDSDPSGRLRRRGLVVLGNTAKGQFRSATVAERFTDFLDEEMRRALFAGSSRQGHLFEFLEDVLEPALHDWFQQYGYLGPFGVDSFFFRDLDGKVRWKPIVEVNPRYTMGRVAVELARFAPSGAQPSLTIAPVKQGPEGSLPITPGFAGTKWGAFFSIRGGDTRAGHC